MGAEQGQVVVDGQKLNKVEALKKAKDGLDVWADIFRYAKATDMPALDEAQQKAFLDAGGRAEDFISSARRNAITEEDFVRLRWWGLYQQLPNLGYFMTRIRIPNGFVTAVQLAEIADITEQYGRGFADITTRQNFQLHWVTIESFAAMLPRLEKVGLVTKFACGDTPRNVVGCPMAGYLAHEHLDASGAVTDVHNMFLAAGKEFSNFPRKFKTAIGGCHLHCHQPQINDIGLFAVVRKNPATGQEERGYGLVVGGGLSTTPHYAQGLRVFIQPGQVVDVCRGIAKIFRDHGYREKRTRARLKFLVADWGWQKFRDVLEQTLGFALEHDESITEPKEAVHTDHMGVGPQKQPGLSYIGVPIERGRITSTQMRAAATIAAKYSPEPKLGLSNKQNLLFLNIPTAQVSAMVAELEKAGLSPQASPWRSTLVTCTGTQFCNLAIVETKERARRILKYLEDEIQIDSPIMISVTGCPNSCGQYQIADIGLMGVVCNFRGVRGTEAFNLMLGGALGADPKFATLALKKIPADYIQKSIGQIVTAYKQNRVDEHETFHQFVGRHTPAQLAAWLTIPEMAEVL